MYWIHRNRRVPRGGGSPVFESVRSWLLVTYIKALKVNLMRNRLLGIGGLLGLALSLTACSTPSVLTLNPAPAAKVESLSTAADSAERSGNHDEEEEECPVAQSAARAFLPLTSIPPSGRILPPTNNDCGFYNHIWQSFLWGTQPGFDKHPAFLDFETFESVFGLETAGDKRLPLLNAGFRQAGDPHAILVDQQHNPIFYSVHLNRIFADFVRQHKINQLANLLKLPGQGGIPADLEFPPGSIEFKAAWKIVEGDKAQDYFTIRARVPLLKNSGDTVVETGKTRVVTVALLSLHVVTLVQDHPEFIWGTFEHIDASGKTDLAPVARHNPTQGLPELDDGLSSYPLFAKGLPTGLANLLPARQLLIEGSQKFADATSVYRVYPASVTGSEEEDFGVTTINQNIAKLFDTTDPAKTDLRRHYHLTGAVWINEPGSEDADGIFKADRSFENGRKEKVLAGEDALSNLAMESFTQKLQPNCLSCHNTLSKEYETGKMLPPRRINVSNLLTLFARQARP